MIFTNQYIKSLKSQEKLYEAWEGGHGCSLRPDPIYPLMVPACREIMVP